MFRQGYQRDWCVGMVCALLGGVLFPAGCGEPASTDGEVQTAEQEETYQGTYLVLELNEETPDPMRLLDTPVTFDVAVSTDTLPPAEPTGGLV